MSSSSRESNANRQQILQDLRLVAGCSRTGVSKVLQVLHSHGELRSDIGGGSDRTIRERLQVSVDDAVALDTPYGRLVESSPLQHPTYETFEFVNPFALLHVLAARSRDFYDLLAKVDNPIEHRKIVLYIDELTPGNPLRHEKSRCTQCVYWTFADLPSHLVVQNHFWFLSTVLRSKVVEQVAGQVSGLMRAILKIFFLSCRMPATSTSA